MGRSTSRVAAGSASGAAIRTAIFPGTTATPSSASSGPSWRSRCTISSTPGSFPSSAT